jgi:peptidyl-prolyl cis-trans isomerase D
VRTYEAIDRSGRGPDGKPVSGLPNGADVINAAFSSDVGVDNDPVQVQGGGFIWFDVTGITPSRERTLEEVKDQVTQHWRDDEVGKRLQAKSDEMLGKLKAGTTLAQLATDNGLKVQTAVDLQRGKPGGFAPAKLVEAAFKTPKDTPAIATGDQETTRFILHVTEVTDPKPNADVVIAKQITTTLQSSYADDIIGAYVTKLESDLGVTVNQQALTQIIGGGGQQ